jgi:hypothetical protein
MNIKKTKVFLAISLFFAFSLLPIQLFASFDYVPMEKIPGFSVSGNFPDYILAVYKFGIWSVGIAALLMIMIGGFMYITSAGNNAQMEKAKGIIYDSVIGILLALTAWLILYVINPELVKIKIISGTINVSGGGGGGGGGSTACSNADAMKQHLAGGGNVCDSTSCSSASAACKLSLQNYDGRIRSVASAKGVGSEDDIKMIKAIICKESGANSQAIGPTGDCGLMQIRDPAYPNCGNGIMDPQKNLEVGIGKYVQKKTAASGSYGGGITKEMMALASYNCCANGDNPNAQSVSCKTTDGWPSIPKWACPIDPGAGQFNMCAVKNYSCDVVACAKTF